MRRAAETISVLSLVGIFAIYVAAKIDFFRRFDPNDISGYLAGHWPFWVAGIGVAILGEILAHLSTRAAERS